jgi:Cft2 family RNA processing exonuclease/dsRNA-specific ribonuclease
MSNCRSIEVSFLGGATTIGASCTLVRVGDTSLVVDCGVRYAGPSALPDLAPLAETPVDAVLVTHAHMDHSGGLPVIAEACHGAAVLATPPTIDLVTILLQDALRLMNGPERETELPLYSERQVDQLLAAVVPVKYHQPMRIKDVEVRWLPAAHILGAAMILLKTPAGTVLFTGDYSVSAQHTVPALGRPDFQADLVISEATYGERLHEDRKAAEERLLSQIREVVARGGRVLIPAFAVGRAQEVLLILKHAQRNGTLPEVPVFVDGMVRAVCAVYGKHEAYVSRHLVHEIRRSPHAFYTDTIQPVTRPEDRKRALATSPGIIVASSGMLAGGPSLAYAQALLQNPQDAIFLTGYQDEESPGRALLDLARTQGPKDLKLGQTTVPVACSFGTYGLSAHADRMQMVSFIEALEPQTVVLVHGDESAKDALRRSLRCQDVMLARDGCVLRRDYPSRPGIRAKVPLAVPAASELDIDRARHLLGPAGEAPLRAAAVAEAWFGQPVDRDVADRFVRVLEGVGLVRRDDDRRDRLWVLGPQETRLFPEEAALEEQLKRANPKGRLLEFCMRMRIDPPQTETGSQGPFYRANMSLRCQGETVASGPQQAASKKAAEQLAAQVLLELVSHRVSGVDVVPVGEEDLSRLQSANPKGRLLEQCAKKRWPAPQFEQHANPQGYQVRAVLDRDDEQRAFSAWYLAATLKAAEQAAAEAMLKILGSGPDSCQGGVPPKEPEQQGCGLNAAMVLNELKQVGILQSFGYEVTDQDGPSHQPVFSIVARATTPDGRTWRTAPVCASSKKSGQRSAAENLLDLLVEHGVTRR